MEIKRVKLREPLGEESIQLSTLDQQAFRFYVDNLLVFQTHDATDLIWHLEQGLAAALCEIPDFAATIVPLPDSTQNKLELLLGPESGVPLRVVDHSVSAKSRGGRHSPLAGQSYQDLAKKHFPFGTAHDEFLFFPREERNPHQLPALLVQINLVEGGLLLGVSFHHTICDAHGMDLILDAWAHHIKHLLAQGTPATIRVPPEQARERWRLSYGSQNVTINQLPEYVVNPARRNPRALEMPYLLDHEDSISNLTASTWYLSPDALNQLRDALNNAAAETGSYFTNGEAVSALLWKHLSLARLLYQTTTQGTSLFATRIDFRARVKPAFHDQFVGNINEPHARTRIALNEVCAASTPQSLAVLAKAIRDAIVSLDEKALRDFIGVVDSLSAVTDLTLGSDTFSGPDLTVTDTSSLGTLRRDWGRLLGKPTCLRTGFREKGVAIFSPQDPDGGFELQLLCDGAVVERLKTDTLFVKYATFRC